MFPIVRRREMAGGAIILNEISAPKIARVAQPGQFVILMAGEKGERIPMTISDIDPVKGTITIIYHVVGRSTAAFKRLQVGEGCWCGFSHTRRLAWTRARRQASR